MIRLSYKSRFRRYAVFACALTTLGVGLSVTAHADETKDHFDKAVALYKEKKNEQSLQEFMAARQAYMAAHKDGPEDASILFWIGFLNLQMQNYKDAVDPLEQAIQINPKSPEAHLNLGNVYDGLHRYDDAVREFKKVIELEPPTASPAKLADPWYNLGSAYYKQRKWPEAINAYQKSAALNPKDPYIMDGLGYVLLETGDTRGAIAAYEKATRLQSDNANFQFNLGLAWLNQAKKALTKTDADAARTRALVPLGRAVELSPANVLNHETYGETLYDLGRDPEAVVQFDKAAQLDPKQYMPVYNMGLAYSRSNQQAKAVDAFDKALRIKPDDRDALHGLALSQSKSNQFEDAAKSYKHLTELTPDDLTAWINLAYCLRAKGDAEGEVSALEEALKHGNDPIKTAMVRRALAGYYYKKGDDDSLKRSQDEFERSLKDAPDNPEALNGLGLLMSKQKKYDDALRYFKQAVAVRPTFDDAYNNLGVVYEAKKDVVNAKASYHKALQLNPKNALAQKNLDRFDKPNTPAAAEVIRSFSLESTVLIGVIMGSKSDWETIRHTVETLKTLEIPHEVKIVSAHRTPDLLFAYAAEAEARGITVIIAGAGGAAHLPGMAAAKTVLPVLGVPVESKALHGMDSLLSIVQMPAGIPVGTLAIGRAGAVNAALLAAAMLGAKYPEIREKLRHFRERQTLAVLENPDPGEVE